MPPRPRTPSAPPLLAWARERWFVGAPAETAASLRAFATAHGVDEIMIAPVAGSYAHEPLDASPGRTQTLELLAAALA